MDTFRAYQRKRRYILSKPNVLLKLYQSMPDAAWDKKLLAKNNNIPIELSIQLDQYEWLDKDSYILARNPWLTEEFVTANLDVIINNKTAIARSFYISINFILMHARAAVDKWNWEHISRRTDLTLDIIQANPTLPWDCENLVDNKNLTIDMIKLDGLKHLPWNYYEHVSHMNGLHMRHIREAKDLKLWDWAAVSRNVEGITSADINNKNYSWEWNELSFNRHITIDVIKANRGRGWNWNILSSFFDLNIIMSNLDLPWTRFGLSSNKQLNEKNIQILSKNASGRWDEFFLPLSHPSLSSKCLSELPLVKDHNKYGWLRYFMRYSCNINEIEEIILNEPGIVNTYYNEFQSNPHLTFKYIKKREEKFKLAMANNEFLWQSGEAYASAIARDIASRRSLICRMLMDFMPPTLPIARYIDYY